MIEQKIYKIIFDTNILWLDNENRIGNLINNSIKDAVKFVKDNQINKNVFLVIPEIVFQERVEQILKQAEETTKTIQNKIKALEPFGVKILEKSYKKNFRGKIIKNFDKILSDSKIGVLITPKYNQNKLIERALKKKKPFSGRGDKGLKDTLIWFTILDDAKKNKNINYILCTKNKDDFNSEELKGEFSKISNKSFEIVDNLGDLKQFLDNNLNLKLKLKELYNKIESEIKELIGDIMVNFHALQSPKTWKEAGDFNTRISQSSLAPQYVINQLGASSSASWGSFGFSDKRAEIAGYNFIDIKLIDVNELETDYFEIEATLIVEPKYNIKDYRNSEIYAIPINNYSYDYNQVQDIESHSINFYFDRKNKLITFKFNNGIKNVY